jgi:hypothetical protein
MAQIATKLGRQVGNQVAKTSCGSASSIDALK